MLPFLKIPTANVQRRFITLLELLIVLAVLSFALGAIGFNIRKALLSQKFHSESNLILDRLRLAQDLMFFGPYEMEVKLEQKEKELFLWLETQDLIENKRMKKLVKKLSKPIRLKVISIGEQSPISLPFKSKGAVMPKGELILSSQKTDQKKSLFLAGYPQTLRFDQQQNMQDDQEEQTEWIKNQIKEGLN